MRHLTQKNVETDTDRISDIDKAGYSRNTYCITADSLLIKEGPYDFIYLAKNYSKDSVYFRKSLSQTEK